MKKSKICFTGEDGSFVMENPHKSSYLYFPLAGENGILSAITPLLSGDAKTGQNAFLLQPASAEDLHNLRSSRNFWLKFAEGGAWSATGVSAETEALTGTELEEETALEAGLMWHRIKRRSLKYGLDSTITSFVPAGEPLVEAMEVTVRNTGGQSRTFTPVAAVPVYGRSADNLRDHRHVTSLLHRITTTEYGVYVKPELSFDERGHKVNSTGYFVCGAGKDGEKPDGTYPLVQDFIGEGGSFTRPASVYSHAEPVPPGTQAAGYEAMGGICFKETVLEPGQSCTYTVFMGITEEGAEKTDRVAEGLGSSKLKTAFEETKRYWQNKVNVKYATGSREFDNMMCWVNFQPVLRRIFGCSFLPHHDYGKGGRGWRDLWQDCLALLIMEPDRVRGMLVDNYAGVRMDGTNATIIGNGSREFVADRNNITRVWMDHGLWPLMTTEFYIHQSGDTGILLEKTVYFKDKQVCRGTAADEKWEESQGVWQRTESGEIYEGTVLEHILLENLSVFYDVGEHNHMLLRGADWNDALDMAASRGESVAFTAAYAGNLETLAGLCRRLDAEGKGELLLLKEIHKLFHVSKEEYENVQFKRGLLAEFSSSVSHAVSGERKAVGAAALAEKLEEMSDWLKDHIRRTEWLETKDGGFYNGYYDDRGRQVEGSHENGIRKMLTSQVFTVMSGTAAKEQVEQIVREADKDLYDASIGGYRLNTDFGELKTDLGRMFGFAYGHKENGAVFSHMAVMYANALYKRGFAEAGYKVLHSLLSHAADFDKSRIYPGIPEYFNDRGRGMYHYLTGAASWMMLTAVTRMFGVRGEWGDLILEPKLLPEQFDSEGKASIELEFAGKSLRVTYRLSREKEGAAVKEAKEPSCAVADVRQDSSCISAVFLNGERIEGVRIPRKVLLSLDSGGRHEIVAELSEKQ